MISGIIVAIDPAFDALDSVVATIVFGERVRRLNNLRAMLLLVVMRSKLSLVHNRH